MRLVKSNSTAIAQHLSLGASICVRDPYAGIHGRIFSNLLIALAIAAVSIIVALPWSAILIVCAVLGVYNGISLCLAQIRKRHWVLIYCGSTLHVRLFTTWGRSGPTNFDVIEMSTNDIRSLSIRRTEIIWSRVRRSIVEWLVIETEPSIQFAVTLEQAFAQELACDPKRSWLVGRRNGNLHIQWSYKPSLQVFLSRVAKRWPALTPVTQEPQRIDLVHFASKTDSEQRDLLGQLKRLGYGAACVLILKRYKHMSIAEAGKYVADLDRCVPS